MAYSKIESTSSVGRLKSADCDFAEMAMLPIDAASSVFRERREIDAINRACRLMRLRVEGLALQCEDSWCSCSILSLLEIRKFVRCMIWRVSGREVHGSDSEVVEYNRGGCRHSPD
jgi:hypothetical protein